jgi:hypothetical protein
VHVGELPLDRLMLRDGDAERAALLGVRDGLPMRPPSSAIMAILKPPFSWPRSASAGTRHPSNSSGTVFDARIPILSSGRPTFRPFVPPSTRKHEMPFAAVSGGDVRAHTMKTPAYDPPVIHCFAPSMTHSSPSRRAVVRMAPGSLPASGSLSAKLARA